MKYCPKCGANLAAAGKTMTPETALVEGVCFYHPNIQAVFTLHNLYRDEHLTLCTDCMLRFCEQTIDIAYGGGSMSAQAFKPAETETSG